MDAQIKVAKLAPSRRIGPAERPGSGHRSPRNTARSPEAGRAHANRRARILRRDEAAMLVDARAELATVKAGADFRVVRGI
jgi:hypothetical protein